MGGFPQFGEHDLESELLIQYTCRVMDISDNSEPELSSSSSSLPVTSISICSDSSSSAGRPSILDRLKSPTPSDLSRSRRIKTNPPKGVKRGKGRVTAEPSSVSASDRIREFPDEHLIKKKRTHDEAKCY